MLNLSAFTTVESLFFALRSFEPCNYLKEAFVTFKEKRALFGEQS